MATGDEHYREAERLVALAESASVRTADSATAYGVMAQVHATLALAAATADAALCADEGVNRYAPGEGDPDRRALGYGR